MPKNKPREEKKPIGERRLQNNCQPPTVNCQLKYLSLSYRSLPVCRSPSGVRKVRATQSTILLNGKLSVRVE